jgi:glutamate-1-semialdehyde aminotransferase
LQEDEFVSGGIRMRQASEGMDAAALSLYDRAAVIPGRSLTRSKKVFGLFAAHAHGAYIYDTSGRPYIDMLCGLGAVSLGYGQQRRYSHELYGVCSLPYVTEFVAAEAVLKHVAPWGSWARFLKTGSEAMHACYRMAKQATRRDTVILFDGSYHGWHEWCDAKGDLAIGQIPARYDLAAIIVEPHRFEGVNPVWLRDLRRLCDESGALLIFDSMIYGGRWHIGGASGYFGIQPDLEAFGKAYGNGQAVAFVVGKENTYAHGEIASGTYSGELSGLAAVVDTLEVYTNQPVIETMVARGRQLREGMDALVPKELGEMQGVYPACQHLHFHNPEHGQQFSQAMLDRGVIWHPLPVLTMHSHHASHINHVLAAAKASLETLG